MIESPPRSSAAPDAASIEKELGRVLSSHTFRRANRMRELLSFVVKRTLEGNALTERGTARAVFGRGEDFDAGIDPEVRVQYGRLRRKLAEYYSTEGKDANIKIELPTRTYEPVFLANHSEDGESQAETSPPPDPTLHSIAVLPLTNLTQDHVHDAFCYGLTEEIITSLALEPKVNVVAGSSAFQYKDRSVDVRMAGEELGVEMILEGSVRMEDDHARVAVRLARVNDGIAIWSNSLNATVDGALSTQQAVAGQIIESLPLESK